MADNQTTAAEPTNGRVTRVQGSVIDVEFPVGHLPDIYNALKVTIVNTSAKEEGEAKETEITLEVEQHLGDSTVRCVALKPTDGLVRGASVSDTGAPISVPVGDVTKGHVFDVSGNILNKKPDETITVSERWPIHRNPPAFDQLESKTQMFETGIKGHRSADPVRAGRQDRSVRWCRCGQDRADSGNDSARGPEPRWCVRVRWRRRAYP